ncbi:MAG: S-methyl-5-thioribose-1-phosphate isomerase [Candidatus Krumholzibacteriota bacterium]|nr:S-methyl-5-thioribose-1-phosphate isomerase [Candidatus Krumholzibacteriota bacterium]
MIFRTIDYFEGKVRIIDQTLLPSIEKYLDLGSVDEVAEAIRSLKVRGAPAIGIAAAYGVLLSLETFLKQTVSDPPPFFFDRTNGKAITAGSEPDMRSVRVKLLQAIDILGATRPTAVNLFHALDRMRKIVEREDLDIHLFCGKMKEEAFRIFDEEIETELKMGEYGSSLLKDGMSVLTHCNAGGLATAGYGTALGVIYSAASEGKKIDVFADETRPLFQGSRLTAWEMMKNDIATTVLCDSAAASLISSGKVDLVITGADRVARNGDTANKTGTLTLAIICSKYKIPFYVAAPLSTFDLEAETGAGIVIENRDRDEVVLFQGVKIAPSGVRVYNPAFDVTPASLITAFITEKGLIYCPFDINIEKTFSAGE